MKAGVQESLDLYAFKNLAKSNAINQTSISHEKMPALRASTQSTNFLLPHCRPAGAKYQRNVGYYNYTRFDGKSKVNKAYRAGLLVEISRRYQR